MIENVYSITPQQINYILELYNERNFQRASDKCFVTQPTLSMQVKKAEEMLGFLIFDRSSTPIELTQTGELLIPVLKDIQHEYSRIATLSKKENGTYKEQLRIGVIPTISAYLIVNIFEKVRAQLPDLQITFIELKSEELVVALEENKIDLGIMAGPYQGRRMRVVPLFKEEITVYIPSSKSPIISPLDIEQEQPWLLSRGNCLRTQMIHFCSLNENRSEVDSWNYEGGNIDLLMKMVDLNGGYTLIPKFYDLKNKELKRLLDPKTGEFPAREIIAIMPNKSIKKESCEAIIRIVQLYYGTKELDRGLLVIGWNGER